MTRASTGIDFRNEIIPSEDFNIFNYRNFYNGGGVALGDIDNDGLVDIYLTSNQGENKLYLNQRNFIFKDITESAGVAGNRFWTTGVTLADVNGNGLLDIYVLNSGGTSAEYRRNELFINQGDLTFKEEAERYHLDDSGYSVHASFFDYDGDGDLDLYLLNNSFTGTGEHMQTLLRKSRNGISLTGGDKFFRNDNGVFTDVSKEAGIYQGEIGFGLGVSVGDLTGDHRPDIYISNDFWEKDYLYINQGDGTFSEEIENRTDKISHSSMGSDIADVNNDGILDIFVTDMLPKDEARIKTMTVFEDHRGRDGESSREYHHQYLQNTLQINKGNGTFTETGFLSGVAATDWSWGALFFDFNNNGWKDLFVSNGIYRNITDLDFADFLNDRENIARIVRERGRFDIQDFLERLPSNKIKNFGFINNRDKTFTNLSDSLGFYEPAFSNGAAWADLDNNGSLDLVVNNLHGEAFVYRNNSGELLGHNYLRVAFEGERENTYGVGAHVKIYTNGQLQVAENTPARSFQSSVPPEIHFGLGEHNTVDSLIVIWPNHDMQVLTDIKANQKIRLKQELADHRFIPSMNNESKPLLEDVTENLVSEDIRHRENEFVDFDRQLLLPRKLSTEGPKIITGDLNGNGLDDFFITGGLNAPDKVFIQAPDGTFSSLTSPDFIGDAGFESTAAAFMDINGNGHLDLMVGSGGNQFSLNSESLQIRVYTNNGDGVFTRARELEPRIQMNVSTIASHDFNEDGTPDVFLGGRVVPGQYGVIPQSYLLQNDGEGNWINDAPDELNRPGMVTDAVWADYDGNGENGLIIVGDWMPVMFYKNEGGNLSFDYSIEESNGWWTAIEKADLNGDGQLEFILGNWGLNSRFQATPEKPISMYVNDFNEDGTSSFIINTYPAGEEKAYPFHTYLDLVTVYPGIRERVQNHHEYAGKTWQELFNEEQIEGALRREIHTLHSSLLVDREGTYTLEKLPLEAQVSPVFGIHAGDFLNRGQMDLLLMGNFFGVKPEVGRLSGNHGIFLEHQGDLNFDFIPYHQTNTNIRGQVRDVEVIQTDDGHRVLVGRNHDELLIYKY
ncbi:MAG: VCBS repeat-containing protein [Balneolales bacterium]